MRAPSHSQIFPVLREQRAVMGSVSRMRNAFSLFYVSSMFRFSSLSPQSPLTFPCQFRAAHWLLVQSGWAWYCIATLSLFCFMLSCAAGDRAIRSERKDCGASWPQWTWRPPLVEITVISYRSYISYISYILYKSYKSYKL